LDQESVGLPPLCAARHSRTVMPRALYIAKPVRPLPSPMQLMYSMWPFELVVPSPVQPLVKPLSQYRETIPMKRKYCPVFDATPLGFSPFSLSMSASPAPSMIGSAHSSALKVIHASGVPEFSGCKGS